MVLTAWLISNSMYSDFFTNEFCLSQRLPHPVMERERQVPLRLRNWKPTFESSLDWKAELQSQTWRFFWWFGERQGRCSLAPNGRTGAVWAMVQIHKFSGYLGFSWSCTSPQVDCFCLSVPLPRPTHISAQCLTVHLPRQSVCWLGSHHMWLLKESDALWVKQKHRISWDSSFWNKLKSNKQYS